MKFIIINRQNEIGPKERQINIDATISILVIANGTNRQFRPGSGK